jgi:hypothetical protein
MGKRTKPSGSRQLVGLIIGYLGGDLLVSYAGLPRGLTVSLVIVSAVAVSGVVVSYKFPQGSYGRQIYKYWLGQLGAWLASLLIGGFLPLLKSFVYSGDVLTYLLLVPWIVAFLYLMLLVQQGFQTPRPVK